MPPSTWSGTLEILPECLLPATTALGLEQSVGNTSSTAPSPKLRQVSCLLFFYRHALSPLLFCFVPVLHKGYLNLGSIDVDICRLVGKKGIFLFCMYLSFPHGFLSMIFGFLGKFRIDIAKNPSKNIFVRDQKNLSKKLKNIFRD